MDNILVVIPLHKLDDEVKPLLTEAIKSVTEGIQIMISTTDEIKTEMEKFADDFKNVKVKSSAKGDFCNLVNNAVSDDYEWFSILEYDDTYTPIWFDNVKEYISFKPETSVFMPLEDLIVFDSKEFAGFGNEAPWASSFSNEIGTIDLDCLQDFFSFYLTGSVFNVDDWKEIGGLKTNIPVYFWYEFLLRAANKGKKIFVIPKVGYTHSIGRKGSLIEEYRENVSNDETKYWMGVAKKEYFFTEERETKPFEKK